MYKKSRLPTIAAIYWYFTLFLSASCFVEFVGFFVEIFKTCENFMFLQSTMFNVQISTMYNEIFRGCYLIFIKLRMLNRHVLCCSFRLIIRIYNESHYVAYRYIKFIPCVFCWDIKSLLCFRVFRIEDKCNISLFAILFTTKVCESRNTLWNLFIYFLSVQTVVIYILGANPSLRSSKKKLL